MAAAGVSGALEYVCGPWPEVPIPLGAPCWLCYEVNEVTDSVLRSVEIFADGSSHRNSLQLQERDGFVCTSLVHGSFRAIVTGVMLERIEPERFEQLWNTAQDIPAP
jgi:hypothetical protein